MTKKKLEGDKLDQAKMFLAGVRAIDPAQIEPGVLSGIRMAVEEWQVWQSFSRFVRAYYPLSAVKVTVVVESEYNDNTYDDIIDSITVEDVHGNVLEPNWRVYIAAFSTIDVSAMSDDQIHDLIVNDEDVLSMDLWYEARRRLDCPSESVVYSVLRPPHPEWLGRIFFRQEKASE